MFNIKKYNVCRATGFVTVEIEFNMWNRPPKKFTENYTTESDAKRRIEHLQIDYLLFTLESYITTCRNLYELNLSVNSNSRKMALDKCTQGLQYLQDKQLSSIATLILKIQPFLVQILPQPSYKDYEFLYSIQLRLTTFCNKVLNPKTKELCPA
jgi:hypothetical protein